MSIKNYLKPYEYELLKSVLMRDGKDIDSEANRLFKEFYTQVVPMEERKTAEEKYRDEHEYNLRLQDGRRFSLIQLCDEGDEYYFTTESHMDFYHAAYAYGKYIRGDEGNYSLDSIAKDFAERSIIDPLIFSLLSKKTDKQIIAIMKFNFDEMTLTVHEVDKPQAKKYKLEDIADAVGKSERAGLTDYQRKLIFEEALDGNEIQITDEEDQKIIQTVG